MPSSHSLAYRARTSPRSPSWIARRSTGSPGRIVVGVPLQPDVGAGDGPLPLVLAPVDLGHEGRMDRQPEDLVEGVPPQPDGERHLLALLGAPARAVHHPQEVRLDPGHAAQAEPAAEVAVPGGEVADLGPVRLVDDDRLGVELGQDVAAGARASGPPGRDRAR